MSEKWLRSLNKDGPYKLDVCAYEDPDLPIGVRLLGTTDGHMWITRKEARRLIKNLERVVAKEAK